MTDPLTPVRPSRQKKVSLRMCERWEALVELLERKGLCTKQEVHDLIAELRTRHAELNGKVIVPGTPTNTKEEQYLIDHMLKVIEAVGLQPAESKELLRRVSLIIDQQARANQKPS
jgi:hypothetical protein